MPFLSLTKGAKRVGIQTFAKASRLMPELKDIEFEYLDARDWYVNQISILTQFQEALEQAKAAGDKAEITELGNRIYRETEKLRDMRERVRTAGERSWTEAFYLAATVMLSRDDLRRLEDEADRLIGRPRHELGASK